MCLQTATRQSMCFSLLYSSWASLPLYMTCDENCTMTWRKASTSRKRTNIFDLLKSEVDFLLKFACDEGWWCSDISFRVSILYVTPEREKLVFFHLKSVFLRSLPSFWDAWKSKILASPYENLPRWQSKNRKVVLFIQMQLMLAS